MFMAFGGWWFLNKFVVFIKKFMVLVDITSKKWLVFYLLVTYKKAVNYYIFILYLATLGHLSYYL